LRQIQSALEMYRSDVGMYPDTVSFVCDNSITSGGVIYMQRIPCDPINVAPLTYRYSSAAPNLIYTLVACLENVNDQQKDSANVAPCNGTSNWSYTLLSP
ncbi:type II secretion system protein GspG, partial [Patescibacteria group bacterium]|nr:type II secretion system protein GspG [Patescibacteria group bacterium]